MLKIIAKIDLKESSGSASLKIRTVFNGFLIAFSIDTNSSALPSGVFLIKAKESLRDITGLFESFFAKIFFVSYSVTVLFSKSKATILDLYKYPF